MQAIRIHQRGGPEVLTLEEVPTPMPGPGEVLIKVAAAGVNYSDVGQQRGNYPNLVPLPTILGNEVVGTIVGWGPGVTGPVRGSRMAAVVQGGYAEYAVAPADRTIPLPDEVSFAQATAIPIQGQTAYLLLTKAGRLAHGERVLIHGAAGDVGSLAVQLAKMLGAGLIIGTDRAPEKLDFIRQLGADHALLTGDPGWVEQVQRLGA